MKTDTILMIFGGLLVLISILGGGFEVKEIKIPRVGPLPRTVAAIVGAISLFVGIGIQPSPESKVEVFSLSTSSPTVPVALPVNTGPVKFFVNDQLGEGQVSEQVTLIIDGEPVGNLTINRHYPTTQLVVKVARPGKHSYFLTVNAVFLVDGELVERSGVGQGDIEVKEGKHFEIQGALSGSTWLVALVDGQS